MHGQPDRRCGHEELCCNHTHVYNATNAFDRDEYPWMDKLSVNECPIPPATPAELALGIFLTLLGATAACRKEGA